MDLVFKDQAVQEYWTQCLVSCRLKIKKSTRVHRQYKGPSTVPGSIDSTRVHRQYQGPSTRRRMSEDPKSQLPIKHYIPLYRIFIYSSDYGIVCEAKQLLTSVDCTSSSCGNSILESSQTRTSFSYAKSGRHFVILCIPFSKLRPLKHDWSRIHVNFWCQDDWALIHDPAGYNSAPRSDLPLGNIAVRSLACWLRLLWHPWRRNEIRRELKN